MIGAALDKYGFRPSRDLTRRVDELERAVEQMHVQVNAHPLPPVRNGSSGQLVISRYRPVLDRAFADPDWRSNVFETVPSDVGALTFPAFDRIILPAIRARGQWEPDETAYLASALRPGMHVLDVGANVGYTAMVMSRAVGNKGLVVAFEPEPLNFELLCHNLWNNGAENVIPVHAAAGDRTGSITLQRSPDNTGDHRTAPHPIGIASVDVPVVAIDDLVPQSMAVDFVFIDAQGFDHKVIQGMTKMITRWLPPMLVEFWPVGILGVGDDPDEVLAGYRSLGYRIELLSDVDVTQLSAEQLLTHSDRDHLTLALVPS
jgi:FkbM family methyltransferase